MRARTPLPVAAALPLLLLLLLSGCAAGGAGSGTAAAPSSATASSAAGPSPAATATAGAAAIEGRWTVPGRTDAWIEFEDGAWRAPSVCAAGIRVPGGEGTYRVVGDDGLRIARTGSRMFGCPVGQDDDPAAARPISAILTARSFRVEGDRLTLLDGAGASLGTLTR